MTRDNATLADMARTLNADYRIRGRQDLPPGFFITDQAAAPDPAGVIAGLPRGFGVILRDYRHPRRAALGGELRALCRARGLVFLVAGDMDLMAALAADGLHLPEGMMDRTVAARENHPDLLITGAGHDPAALRRLAALPVDAALVAPIFPTRSHPETFADGARTLGPDGLRRLVAESPLPLYALGGITKENARQLSGSGVAGIAAIRGFCVA